MTLVEGIRGKLLPIGPDLFQRFRLVAIGLTTRHELALQVVHLVDQLLTHCLTQGIALATGEIGQQTREQHDLLLIDCNAVCIFQVTLHHRNVILDLLLSLFTGDKRRNIVHRSRTVEGIHGNQVLELGGLQLLQVLLHTGRLKLEGTGCLPFAIELVGGLVLQTDVIDVQLLTGCLADILYGLLDDGKRFQPQEVHLDQTRLLDDRSLILGHQHLLARILVLGRADRYHIRNIVPPNDDPTGMDTRITHIALQHLGIFQGIAQQRVIASGSRLQFIDIIDRILQLEFLHVRNLVRHQFGQSSGFIQWQLLDTRHIGNGRLGRHRTIRDDVCHPFGPILVRHPTQHLPPTIIIEVGINIGQRDTVRIQETLEQQIIFDRVNPGNTQAVGNRRTGCRTTTGTHRHP